MPFQLHFVLPENQSPEPLPPDSQTIYTGLCVGPDGQLTVPPLPECTGCLLSFHDATPIPATHAQELAKALTAHCIQKHASGVFVDFERQPTAASVRFLSTLVPELAAAGRTCIIPERYDAAVPGPAALLCRYDPAAEPYAAFLQRCIVRCRPFYLELVPICRLVPLPQGGCGETALPELEAFLQQHPGPIWHSVAAECNCLHRIHISGVTLGLYDTKNTLVRRLHLAQSAGASGALCLYPEWAAYEKGSLPDGKEPL